MSVKKKAVKTATKPKPEPSAAVLKAQYDRLIEGYEETNVALYNDLEKSQAELFTLRARIAGHGPPTTLELLIKDVVKQFPDDQSVPGVHLSWIPATSIYYAAIHRYRGRFGTQKYVFLSTSAKKLGEVIRKLRGKFDEYRDQDQNLLANLQTSIDNARRARIAAELKRHDRFSFGLGEEND